jgi:hypothetical protein
MKTQKAYIFFHPDFTVGIGVAPIQRNALADYRAISANTLTAGVTVLLLQLLNLKSRNTKVFPQFLILICGKNPRYPSADCVQELAHRRSGISPCPEDPYEVTQRIAHGASLVKDGRLC